VKTAIMVYDGGCGMCSSGSQWVRRLDWLRAVSPVPLQSATLYVRFPSLQPQACWQAMHVILPGGRIRIGGDALRAVLARLPLTMPLALILAVPPLPQLLRAVYPWFANRRRAISALCGMRPRIQQPPS
jgi:predicted DCC family thiol-disulfide oxidoreductase YuxK